MVDTKRTIDADGMPPGGTVLELVPLLAPYKDHKRLSVRVERLPLKARLSTGRNNGDGTWSLARDDLDGLLYLPPKGLNEPHSLSIRVISFDSDAATTLAQFDLPINLNGVDDTAAGEDRDADENSETNVVALSSGLTKARKRAKAKLESGPLPQEPWTEITPDGAADVAGQVVLGSASPQTTELKGQIADLTLQLKQIADEAAAKEKKHVEEVETLQKRHAEALKKQAAKVEEAFAQKMELQLKEARAEWEEARSKWEAEQALTRQKISEAKAGSSKKGIEDAVAKARNDWEREAQKRLAEMEAAADARLEESRSEWDEERETLLAEAEAAAAARLAEVRAEWQREVDAALSTAKETWKAEEAERLAAAETHWQAQAKRDLAEVTARYKKAEAALVEAHKQVTAGPEANKDAELRRLRDTLAATQSELTDRDKAVAEMRKEIERVKKEKAGPSVDAELAKARKASTRELEDRLADAAAEAEAKLEKARATWQKEMDERLAQTVEENRERIEQAERRGQRDVEAAVAEERQAWKAEEAARLAESEAQWRRKFDKALAEATVRYEKAEVALAEARAQAEPKLERDPNDVAELDRLSDALAAARGTVSKRDAELAKATARAEKAEAALVDPHAKSEPERDPDDIAELRRLRDELAAAQSAVSERDTALAEAAERAEKAETARVDSSRARRDDGRDPDDVVELRHLRDALATAQASLSERDSELAQVRAAVDQARQGLDAEIRQAVKKAQEEWKELDSKRIWAARIQWRKEAQSAQARAAVTKLGLTRRRWPSPTPGPAASGGGRG